MNTCETKKIIEKWYKKLNFPSEYDAEFYKALNETEMKAITVEELDTTETDGKKNLFSVLYLSEALSEQYAKKGIPEEILLDTLSDIVSWFCIWSELKGGFYMGETGWLKNHLSMNLFQLGRLQFAFGKSEHDIPEKNIRKGDAVIEVHIPWAGSFQKEECMASVEKAKAFFQEFYPEYSYCAFTCHSWLLDETLKNLLKPESNILSFQAMFEVFHPEEAYDILKYVLNWDATKENAHLYAASSSLAKKAQEWVADGKKFYVPLGVIEKEQK